MNTTTDPSTPDRAACFAKAATLLPPDADLEHVMRLAEWLDGRTVLLDPERLRAAARARAAMELDRVGNPRDYDTLPPSKKVICDGEVTQLVSAYLGACIPTSTATEATRSSRVRINPGN